MIAYRSHFSGRHRPWWPPRRWDNFLLPLDRKPNVVVLVFLIRRNTGDPFAIGGLCEALLLSPFALLLFLYRGQSAVLYDKLG
jgi:hypothetical protein